MYIETDFGKIKVGNPGDYEGNIYLDCYLEEVPEILQEHIDKIVSVSKQRAFEERKERLRAKGYLSLEELEKDYKIETEKSYIGIELNMRSRTLTAQLYINGNDTASEGILLEFHHIESIAIDRDVILGLILTAVKKSAPAEQTMLPVTDCY